MKDVIFAQVGECFGKALTFAQEMWPAGCFGDDVKHGVPMGAGIDFFGGPICVTDKHTTAFEMCVDVFAVLTQVLRGALSCGGELFIVLTNDMCQFDMFGCVTGGGCVDGRDFAGLMPPNDESTDLKDGGMCFQSAQVFFVVGMERRVGGRLTSVVCLDLFKAQCSVWQGFAFEGDGFALFANADDAVCAIERMMWVEFHQGDGLLGDGAPGAVEGRGDGVCEAVAETAGVAFDNSAQNGMCGQIREELAFGHEALAFIDDVEPILGFRLFASIGVREYKFHEENFLFCAL